MIRGLMITMRGEELKEKITERIHVHAATADVLDDRIRKREGDLPFDIRIEDGLETFGELLARRDRHRGRAAELKLFRDHLIADETYALTSAELCAVDLMSRDARAEDTSGDDDEHLKSISVGGIQVVRVRISGEDAS